MNKSYNFDEIITQLDGQYVNFYGVDGNCFKLGNFVFEAIEDESDGYRSMLGEFAVVEKDCIFSGEPIASVKVTNAEMSPIDEYSYNFKGYCLEDKNGHIWLRMGTSNYDDYYPMFTFEYTPPKSGISVLIDAIMER